MNCTVYLDGAVRLAARVLSHAAVRPEVLRLEVPHRQEHVDLVVGVPLAVLDVVLLWRRERGAKVKMAKGISDFTLL